MVITGAVESASVTVTVAVQVAWPAEFSAVIVTVTVPAPTGLPAGGSWETAEQPVATTSLTRFGMTAPQVPEIVLLDAQVVIVGGAAAVTVTVKSQPGPSVLVQDTVLVPTWNVEPDAGLHETVPQFPLVVGTG